MLGFDVLILSAKHYSLNLFSEAEKLVFVVGLFDTL